MEDQEQLRVALKKAHEIKTKLDEFILHLSSLYIDKELRENAELRDRDTENSTIGQEECLAMETKIEKDN